ncbi:septum formation family protein [Microbacterium sp. NPDC079995]|uniref:septum formation family protein n=1 Tax=unclassified Microbacterium TaxID=2609290 RepID=UPI00344CEA9A
MSTATRRGRLPAAAAAGVILLVATPMLAGCAEVMYGVARGMMQAQNGPVIPPADDDPSTHLQVSLDALDVGDCYDIPELDESAPSWSSAVYPVPCDEPHMYELYADIVLPESRFPADEFPDNEYPGEEDVWSAADEVCYPAFEAYVGEAYEDSPLEFWYYTPAEQSWRRGDRQVLCVLGHEEEMVTGSAEGSGAKTS